MIKHNNESFDSILAKFNQINNTNFIRIENYKGIHEKIKLYNDNTDTYHYTTLMDLKYSINRKKSIKSLKQCNHQNCSYNECIYQHAKNNINKLIDIYINSNQVQKDIANFLNISVSHAVHIIKDLGINDIYKNCREDRIYSESFCYNPFSDINKMNADEHWLLGYLLADGSIGTRKKKTLDICSIDKELIENCCKIFKLDYSHIKESISNRNIKSGENHTYYSLGIADNNICDSLIDLGVIPNKTYNSTNIKINPKYKFDFLRGLFDGDGCASKGLFSLIGHSSYIKQIHKDYFNFLQLKENDFMSSLQVNSIPKSLWLYHKMYYKDDLPCLTRKRLKLYDKIKHLKLEKVSSFEVTNEKIPVCDLNIWRQSHIFCKSYIRPQLRF